MKELYPFINSDERYMLSPYKVSYWDDGINDRVYVNCGTLKSAQKRFTEILMNGNTNVEILQIIMNVHFTDGENE